MTLLFVGGLGGTNLYAFDSEGGAVDTYQGIDLNNPNIIISYREETVKRLVKDLHLARVLLVRSPPMAGKSSLAQLLEQYLLRTTNARVFRISILWLRKLGCEPWTFEEQFKTIMNGTTWNACAIVL